ncbi:hypothetical protein KV697_18860 [Sphingomonas sanguinis]|uniref:M61 family metallopeptidase n=1 Tax=Sphingomonas sanguinis TaxID=33051 RepID=UPI001C570695|nr:hypothetical protein [Sphingomonas sanguinis]QXT35725.1 hypothetical protein KV697_18860 [Sphingomonas sanguinis]
MRALLIAFAALSLIAAAPSARIKPVHYRLKPELAGNMLIGLRVEIDFQGDPSGTTDLHWNSSWAGEKRLWQWARDMKVEGATALKAEAGGHWRIIAPPGARLTATYRIISAYDHDPTVEDSEQARPVIRPGWFYAVGNALFAHPGTRTDIPATFDWVGAPGIGFASDLEHLAGQQRKAKRPGTIDDIDESIVIGGRELRLSPATDGSGVRIASVGRYAFSSEELADLSRRIIGVERDFWNTDRGAPFLVTAAPLVAKPMTSSYGGTGRGDAFALWMDQRMSAEDLKWLLAHEYFHSWNSPRLRNVDDREEQSHPEYWFSEGFTDYYARALLLRSGLITPERFAEMWNTMFALYAGSTARGMTDAQTTAAFWSDQAAGKMPYQRGAMLAALWNARLLAASGGRRNLDTVLHDQLARARTVKGTAAALFRQSAQASGLDITTDERRYLREGQPILLPADAFGPCATMVTSQRPVFSRGFDTEATAASGNIATGVDPALPAYAAGLRNGMKILERVEGEPGNAMRSYALLVDDHGTRRTIRYLPQGLTRETVQQMRLTQPVNTDCRRTLSGMRVITTNP